MSWRDRLVQGDPTAGAAAVRSNAEPIGTNGTNGDETFSAKLPVGKGARPDTCPVDSSTDKDSYRRAESAKTADAGKTWSNLVGKNYSAKSAESAVSPSCDGTRGGVHRAIKTDAVTPNVWQLHRLIASDVPSIVSETAGRLVEAARRRGAVLVADGLTLKVVERDPLPPSMLAALRADAGAVITVLRHESATRCGWQTFDPPTQTNDR